MTTASPAASSLSSWVRGAAVVGAIGVGVSLLGAFVDKSHFFRAWLVAFIVVLGFALGSLVLLMLNYLVGGNWGFVIRRPLEAATRTLPLVALFFVPLIFGMQDLFLWARLDLVAHDSVLAKKAPYLDVTFFLYRAAGYFVIWYVLGFLLSLWSKQQDTAKSPAITDRCAGLSGPGILLYVITITFASIDWAMSLEPHWYSTIYMAIFGMGQVLAAFVLAVAVTLLLSMKGDAIPEKAFPVQTQSDLGSLMMAFVMVFAYLQFCQFLLIWSGNLPIEVTWYIRRGVGEGHENAWTTVALALVLFHFAVPFFLLVTHEVKRNKKRLLAVALLVLVMRVIEIVWNIVPAFAQEEYSHATSFMTPVLYPAAIVGVGGVWLAFYLWQLQRLPLLPAYNPEEAAHGEAH